MKVNPYRASGTFNGLSYIEREADRSLLRQIEINQRYPYLLAPRQSGKSSLIVHIINKLNSHEFKSIFIDLSVFPKSCLDSYDEFLEEFIKNILSILEISCDQQKKEDLDKILKKITFFFPKRIIIFVDEIDALLEASFKDNFFALIRSLFNKRAFDEDFKKIQFVLAGAALPNQLISKDNISPFNIGIPIKLNDLSLEQVSQMVECLYSSSWKVPISIVSELYTYTKGSVYLLQLALEKLWELVAYKQEVEEINLITVREIIIEIIQEAPNNVHFVNIHSRISSKPELVKAFQDMLEHRPIAKDYIQALQMAGITTDRSTYRNPIYEAVFNPYGSLPLDKKYYIVQSSTKVNYGLIEQSERNIGERHVKKTGNYTSPIGKIGEVWNIKISDRDTLLSKPFQVPPLPSHFVDRPEITQNLKFRLLAETKGSSDTMVISAIYGLGGIGKTFLAQALAHDLQVQERFCDGILWATLGQQPDVLSLLQGWIVALKDYDYKPTTVRDASAHLRSLLYNKAVLLVIDDGWNVEDIEPFRVGSGKCQVIITTRRADVAEEVDAQLYSLDLMSEQQSLMLLANRLGRKLEEEEKESAQQLAAAVGYLPIALALAAAHVARGKPWAELNRALTAEIARLEVLEGVRRRSKKETRLEASFNLSLNVLREDFPETWDSFVWLGVLPEDISITAPMVATLWEVEVKEAADRLELFWNDALLLPGVAVKIGQTQWKTYRLHDLLHDLACRWLTTKQSPGLGLTIPKAHSLLLERYQKHLKHKKWHKLKNDGYIHDHLTWHMEKAECVDLIHQLLREETKSRKNGWYLACERLGKTAIFVGDIARAWKLTQEEYESNPTKAIGLQCRYSLITSSLNTIAGNIPPELITVLVEKKVWSSAQGLAYSRQVQSLSQRVTALSQLGSYFPEIWSEALEAARNIGSEFNRARVLSSLASHLPENLVSEALEAARNIGSESYRAEVLSSLAPHLPENLVSEALEAARNIGSEYDRARVLSSLAPHLPEIC